MNAETHAKLYVDPHNAIEQLSPTSRHLFRWCAEILRDAHRKDELIITRTFLIFHTKAKIALRINFLNFDEPVKAREGTIAKGHTHGGGIPRAALSHLQNSNNQLQPWWMELSLGWTWSEGETIETRQLIMLLTTDWEDCRHPIGWRIEDLNLNFERI